MTVTSSLVGHPKGGDTRGDYRRNALYSHLAGLPNYTNHAVTNVKIRNTFIYTPMRGANHFHLPMMAVAAWMDGERPKYMVKTRCGRQIGWFATSMDAPADLEMCDACVLADLRQPCVYRFYDLGDRLLYVGYTIDPLQRFKKHARQRESQRWWPLQCRNTITWFDTEESAQAAETAAITDEKPIFNRRGVPQREWAMAA